MAVKLLFTLICDDVRFENTNKLLFIGVYNYVITFPSQPTTGTSQQSSQPGFPMPKLCIVRHWLVESHGHKARTEVYDPSGKPLLILDRELETQKDSIRTYEIFQVLGPIMIPGKYKITTTYDDRGPQTNEEYFEVRVVDSSSLGPVVAQPVLSTQG